MANVPSGIGALSGYGMPVFGATPGAADGALQPQMIDNLLKAQLVPLPGVPGRPQSYAPFEMAPPLTRTSGPGGAINPAGPSALMFTGLQPFAGTGAYSPPSGGIAAVPGFSGAGGSVAARPPLPRSGGKGAVL
jgi:hypothetical protein